jgi:hypothetical protein
MSGPDQITAWVWKLPYPSKYNGKTEWTADIFPADQDCTTYVRRDPAVLAALPEVKALIEAERERCISRVRDNWVAGAKTTLGEVLAAIRKGATP